MTWKKVLFLAVIAISIFAFGWFMNDMYQFAGGVIEDAKHKTYNGLTEPITPFELDPIIVSNDTIDYSKMISGRFILEDAKYAGFNFFNSSTITWTNEIMPSYPDTLTITWLNNNTFCTRSTQRYKEGCPPSVRIYKVIKFDGNQLVLSKYWTGWNNYQNDISIFYRQEGIDIN